MQNPPPTYSVQQLTSSPESIPRLAELWQQLIGKVWAPEIPLEDIRQRFTLHLNEDTLPLTMVAFNGNMPVGMCSLRENDGISTDLKPWLGSLVVGPAFQKQRIGRMLVNTIKKKAQSLGFQKLYLFAHDTVTANYYIRLGWVIIPHEDFKGHDVIVMEITL